MMMIMRIGKVLASGALLLPLWETTHAFCPIVSFKEKAARVPVSSVTALAARASQDTEISRSTFLTTTVAATTAFCFPASVHAFRGGTGAGGLGKTKPETGVVFLNEASVPVQQRNGDVMAELVVNGGKTPVLVSYNSPWPLLDTTSGMETRNLKDPESAFVQVVDGAANKKLSKDFFAETLFSSEGKYGAYGAPSDIIITPIIDDTLFKASFTSLTPAMRESERRAYIATRRMGDSVVMLVTGSTTPRFNKKEEELRRVAESFQVVASPKTSMTKGQS
jgi:hypothetical protein